MIILTLILAICLIALGMYIIFKLARQRKEFGILMEKKRIYQDTEGTPGEILSAKSIPLLGKPDYLIQDGNYIIPVEKKTTTAPKRGQYMNNVMQLMAYCLLVEENFGIRPPGGYIKYNDKEVKVQYTKEAEKSVRMVVKEILQAKKTNKEPHCKHPQHNI